MHFTYRGSRSPDLQQGDILRLTPALKSLIQSFHPSYLRDDYSHFMVLTQSCDLVTRESGCATPYITIGAVRPLQIVIDRETQRYQTNAVLKKANVISQKYKERIRLFLKSLLNNNNHEYFYIHEQPIKGITDRSCAFLRLSISFRASHYDVIKRARILSLAPQFQAKLGWLVGNIYSRVGTDDWVPKAALEADFESLVDQIIAENDVMIVNEKQVNYVKKHNSADVIANWDAAQARAAIAVAPSVKRKEEVLDAVIEHLVASGFVGAAHAENAKTSLNQSPVLASMLQG